MGPYSQNLGPEARGNVDCNILKIVELSWVRVLLLFVAKKGVEPVFRPNSIHGLRALEAIGSCGSRVVSTKHKTA